MAKILGAKDYGYRKVIMVVLNPDEPEIVHADGSPRTGDGPGCTLCRYNWEVREFVWTGPEMYTESRFKTLKELLDEVIVQLQKPPEPRAIPLAIGKTL